MINVVWMLLIGLGIGAAIAGGKTAIITGVFMDNAGSAIEFAFGLAGVIAFWSGILKIAEVAGITNWIARLFQPVLGLLFPQIKQERSILGLISLTVAANLLGLGNVATPLGLKTMEKLQSLNPDPDRASDEICTFMTLIFGGLSLVPTTLIAVRAQAGSSNPALVLGPVFLVTLAGTVIALFLNFILIKLDLKKKRR